jgi:hypothetical protein
MWPRDEREQEEERQTLTELFNIDWRETSFVGRGDNPPARIVLWKQEPDLTDGEIEEILDEVERGSSEAMTTKLRKEGDVLAERDRLAREKMVKQEGLTISQARMEVWMENPALREAYRQAERDHAERMAAIATGQEELVEKAAQRPYAELHRVAKAELPELYRSNPSAAVSEIASSRPDLVASYSSAVRS